jgi:hypothetical protein
MGLTADPVTTVEALQVADPDTSDADRLAGPTGTRAEDSTVVAEDSTAEAVLTGAAEGRVVL